MPQELEQQVRSELGPDLEVLRVLGEGSHAIVFLAREPALRRLVAIKVLRPELASDPVMPRRFEREAQAVASIAHRNVMAIYRVGRLTGDIPFFVMEYIEGRTLANVVEATGPLPLDQAQKTLAGVAGALSAAHARGIVHRDVRPGNVFVEHESGRPVLADFGIAALVPSGSRPNMRLTTKSDRLGDIRYMSPEQVSGNDATEQSDVYSFGILAYEVLTGRGPYDVRGMPQMITAHLRGEPQALQHLRTGIDPVLARVVERCLEKDPNRRPRSSDIAVRLSLPPGVAGAAEVTPPPPPATGIPGFLAELKRRRVYQVAVAYVVIGAGAVEAANNFFPALQIPEAANTVVAVLVLAGFPLALVLSWIYDITAGGIRRTGEPAGEGEVAAQSLALPLVALGVTILLAGLFGWLVLR